MNEQALRELYERTAKHEEQMNTNQAKYESALKRLRADMAQRDAEMARRDADRGEEMAKRNKHDRLWLIGLWFAIIVVIGTLVRLPI